MDDASRGPLANQCRICGSADLTALTVREMMFGTRRPFDYVECASCGCIQIAGYRDDIAEHYPDTYYSFQDGDAPISALHGVKGRLKAMVLAIPALHRHWIASAGVRRWLDRHPAARAMVDHAQGPLTRILDVGCGAGQLLKTLDWLGYRRLNGVDPFIKTDIRHRGRTLVRKLPLSEVSGSFGLISLHHALEHMPDQHAVMRDLHRLLAPGGRIVIRIPVTGGEAWRRYREKWAQLDAPRHYYVHSRRSIALLGEQAGLRLTAMEDDSTSFQFWASELYARDVSLLEADTATRANQGHHTPGELQAFEKRAAAANQASDGDQIVAIFQHK